MSITRVSVDSTGQQTAGASPWRPAISADGRFVAFDSAANNLVLSDTNGVSDIFVHDRATGVTERVSVGSAGQEGNWDSHWPTISADGRFVAFESLASNLVPGDTNNLSDIYVHDRQTGTTTRVNVDNNGYEANGFSKFAAISADGRFVAFVSIASNLVLGDTNGADDVFVHDRQMGTTSRVSVTSAGQEAHPAGYYEWAAISADGRFVAFSSDAVDLVPGDTNGQKDIFVHDGQTGETTRVSVTGGGQEANGPSSRPAISADGRFVAFQSGATNLVLGESFTAGGIFVHDRQARTTTRINVNSAGDLANNVCILPTISASGRFVAFESNASNLSPGDINNDWDFDVFVHDRQTRTTTRVSVGIPGQQTQYNLSEWPAISGDGHFVAFTSYSSNLVPGDTNNLWDIFVASLSIDEDPGATPPGSDVVVQPKDPVTGESPVTITFDNVTEAGETTVTTSGTGQPPPTGLKLGDPPTYYEISTTALFDGPVTVCIDYTGVNFKKEDKLELMHWTGSGWEKITTSLDAESNIICGEVTSLSPFAIFEPANQSPTANAGPDQTVTCAALSGTKVTLDGTGSTDPDGDTLTYRWTGPFTEGDGTVTGATPSVTLPLGTHTITLTVDDGNGGTATDTVQLTIGVGVVGVPPPLNELVSDGWFVPLANRAFRAGSTLPLRMKLYCGNDFLSPQNVAPPRITALVRNGDEVNLAILDLDAGQANDEGALFRFANGLWIFNLSTKGWATGTYVLTIEMPDRRAFQAAFVLR